MKSLIMGTAVYGLIRRYRHQGLRLTPVAQRPLPSWPPQRDPWLYSSETMPLPEVNRHV